MMFFFSIQKRVFHVGTSSIVTCRITLWFSSYRFWIFLLSLHLHFLFSLFAFVTWNLSIIFLLWFVVYRKVIDFCVLVSLPKTLLNFLFIMVFRFIILKFPDVQSCCLLIGMVLILPFKFLCFQLFSLVYFHSLISLL